MKVFDDEVKLLGVNRWKFKYLWLPGAVAFIILLSWQVAIMPRITDIQQFQADTEAIKLQVNDLDQKRVYLTSADENDLNQKEGLLEEALPGNKNIYFLLSVVQTIAAKYNYVVDSFSVSPGKVAADSSGAVEVVKDDALTRVPVTITLLGLNSNYLDLVDAIEHSLPLLSIDAFKMVSDSNNGTRLELTVATYFSTDKFDIKVNNLKLSDLTLSREDQTTIATLSAYHPLDVSSLMATGSGRQYSKYDRNDPFANF